MSASRDCIIITGAAGNLGSAVAAALVARGMAIVCVDRTEEALATVVSHLPREAEVLSLPGYDLSDKAAADAVVEAARARFGHVTGLVNTVGGFRTGRVAEDALSHWDMMMTLNAKVALVTSAAVLPALIAAGRGRIVHISAQPGVRAVAGQAAYAASKAAVLRLMESIAAEHRKDRITANCILPGTIDTPQNRAAMPDTKPDAWIAPAAIAETIAFLLSPAGALVTGAAIPATGLV